MNITVEELLKSRNYNYTSITLTHRAISVDNIVDKSNSLVLRAYKYLLDTILYMKNQIPENLTNLREAFERCSDLEDLSAKERRIVSRRRRILEMFFNGLDPYLDVDIAPTVVVVAFGASIVRPKELIILDFGLIKDMKIEDESWESVRSSLGLQLFQSELMQRTMDSPPKPAQRINILLGYPTGVRLGFCFEGFNEDLCDIMLKQRKNKPVEFHLLLLKTADQINGYKPENSFSRLQWYKVDEPLKGINKV